VPVFWRLGPMRRRGGMEPSDEVLIQGCRRGDAAAWDDLVARYQRLVYSIPPRAGLDEEAAAAVFQNGLPHLAQKIDAIAQPERIQAWLVTTARRETWRHISRRRASRAATSVADDEDDDLLDSIADPAILPDEAIARLEAQHRVRAAVASLDPRCRE